MDLSFKSNEEVIDILSNHEFIPLLEHIIEKEGKEFIRLKKVKERGLINLGEKIWKKERDEIFYQTRIEVNALLDIDESALTRINLRFSTNNLSFYNCMSSTIEIKRRNKYSTKLTLAHEYTHFLQDQILIDIPLDYEPLETSMFFEGHARGVERLIIDSQDIEEDKDKFRWVLLKNYFYEFKEAYWFLCDKLNFQKNKNLLNFGEEFNLYNFNEEQFSKHALGNALFQIYEELHGKNIYKQVLQD